VGGGKETDFSNQTLKVWVIPHSAE
jgi:hypothetical protein